MGEVITPAGSAPEPGGGAEVARGGLPIGEDWLATIVGLVLVVLALLGVIGKGVIP